MSRFVRWFGGPLSALLLIVVGLTAACSRDPGTPPAPRSWYVTVPGGACYVGYIYDRHEAEFVSVPQACTPMLYPSYEPVPRMVDYAAAVELWNFELTYANFIHSGYYYDTYLSPMSARYNITIVTQKSYIGTWSTFDKVNAPQIKAHSAKAQWSNGKTGNYNFPASNQAARNKPLTNANTGGSNAYGTSNSRDRSGPITNTGSGSRTGTTSSGGKTGSRR